MTWLKKKVPAQQVLPPAALTGWEGETTKDEKQKYHQLDFPPYAEDVEGLIDRARKAAKFPDEQATNYLANGTVTFHPPVEETAAVDFSAVIVRELGLTTIELYSRTITDGATLRKTAAVGKETIRVTEVPQPPSDGHFRFSGM